MIPPTVIFRFSKNAHFKNTLYMNKYATTHRNLYKNKFKKKCFTSYISKITLVYKI